MAPAAACNGGHSVTSDLPQLTGEDLQILDAFDQIGGGAQLGQFSYQQTTMVNGSVLM